jgi:hypothetical protein
MGNCKSSLVDTFLVGVNVYSALPPKDVVLKHIAEKQERIVSVSECNVVEGGEPAYERIKRAIMKWDIYGGTTTVYFKGEEIVQGDVIAISTLLAADVFPLSFEDVTDINEIHTPAFSQLRVVVTTRQENIVDGNYTVDLKLFRQDGEGRTGSRAVDDIEIYYQKRQNLQYWLLEKAIGSHEEYRSATEKSVKLTLDRLRAFGSPDAVSVPAPFELIEGVKTAMLSQKRENTREQ